LKTALAIGFGVIAVGVAVYALALLRTPSLEPTAKPEPPPAIAPAPPAPLPSTPPPAPAPPPTAQAAPLHLSDSEQAAVAPIVHGVRTESERLFGDFREHRLTQKELGEALKQKEAQAVEELTRVLGPERAQAYLQQARGGP
jgi:hypothetical protein